jgi:predicted acetyltransferase
VSRPVELVEADPTRDRTLLDRLLQLYEYDYSEYGGVDVDEQGLFPTEDLDARWKPGYDVYLLRVDGQTAGFAIATRHPSYLDGTEVTFLDNFFVMRKYRRQGVGTRAAHGLFRRYPGRWELTTATGNEVARAFWPRAIGAFGSGDVRQVSLEREHGPLLLWAFTAR